MDGMLLAAHDENSDIDYDTDLADGYCRSGSRAQGAIKETVSLNDWLEKELSGSLPPWGTILNGQDRSPRPSWLDSAAIEGGFQASGHGTLAVSSHGKASGLFRGQSGTGNGSCSAKALTTNLPPCRPASLQGNRGCNHHRSHITGEIPDQVNILENAHSPREINLARTVRSFAYFCS